MTFLPMAHRELRAAARRKSTYRIRWWTALIAMLAGACGLLASLLAQGRGNPGGSLFTMLTGYAFGLCLLAGVFLTADSLSEEKREGTLGLLFLTDLKGHDVVLGKFMARALNAFYGLLALLPIIGLPLLLGGVTGSEFWRMALALANALFFSLAAGIGVSALARDSQRAMGGALSLLILFVAGLPILARLGSRFHLAAALAGVSPLYPFTCARDTIYRGGPGKFWGTLLASHLVGWLFLALASWLLPRLWQERTIVADTDSVLMRWLQPARRSVEERARTRETLLPINPVLWLMNGEINTSWVAWLIVLGWGLVVLLMTVFMSRGAAGAVLGWYVVRPFGFLLKVIFTFQVCRFFMEARRNGALEMLLCTPLPWRDILRGQSLALRRSFLWPLVVFLALLFVPLAVQTIGLWWGADFPAIIGLVGGYFFAVLCVVRTFADFWALYWCGLWLAVSVKKPAFAPGLTILFVLVLPTMISFCFLDIFADLFFILWGVTKLQPDLRWLIGRQDQRAVTNLRPRAVMTPGVPPIIGR